MPDISHKILIRTPNHLGDCLMAQPAVWGLAKLWPDVALFLAAPDWAEPVFRGIERENVRFLRLKAEQLHGFKGIAAQIKILKQHRFEIGVAMPPSFSSALVLTLLGVERRYGYPGQGRKALLNFCVEEPKVMTLHRAHKYQILMEQVASWRMEPKNPAVIPTDSEIVLAETALMEVGLKPDAGYVVMAPQAVAASRRWGAANYAGLAEKLIAKYDVHIILLGTAQEFSAGEEVRKNNPRIINLCGKTDPRSKPGTGLGVASAILSKARLFIGNDSGLAHLAAASGIGLVVLSGADNPAETSPLSERKTVIIKDELPCISCVKNICPLKGDTFMRCMKEISVEEVLDAAAIYLE